MSAARLTKILAAQYAEYWKDPYPHLIPAMSERDCRVWHFLVFGLTDSPWKGGEYIYRITAGDNFPREPPAFEVLTPNGLYEPGGPICVSIGQFHKDNWRPSLGMVGFAKNALSGMICHEGLDHGIRIQPSTPAAVRRSLATASPGFNEARFPDLMREFELAAALHPEAEPCRLWKPSLA